MKIMDKWLRVMLILAVIMVIAIVLGVAPAAWAAAALR
jgi:hypothetical protein